MMTTHAVGRERFMAAMEVEGMPREISRRILRHAQTIQRLSEAECNGDWPCDNGERLVKFCSRCEAGYAPVTLHPVRGAKTSEGKGVYIDGGYALKHRWM